MKIKATITTIMITTIITMNLLTMKAIATSIAQEGVATTTSILKKMKVNT